MVEQFQSTRPGGARRILSASVEQSKFQSTRPGGARLTSYARGFMQDMFQSTRPGGRDVDAIVEGLKGVEFQSTRPGGRDPEAAISFQPRMFQSTRPGGRDIDRAGIVGILHGFNPRAPAGATLPGRGRSDPPMVSIHAPRRARRVPEPGTASMVKFQSTRPGGRDAVGQRGFTIRNGFNPRAPAGRDPAFYFAHVRCESVSIHAPRRARRFARIPEFRLVRCFNPRAPAGATLFSISISTPYQFQSTRPGGRDGQAGLRQL